MSVKLSGYGVVLTPITQEKIEQIRQWRNHPEIAQYMFDQTVISKAQQQRWFNSLAEKKDSIHWLISYKTQDIGLVSGQYEKGRTINETNIVMPGLYIAPECKYRNSVLAFSPSLVILEYFFDFQNIERLVAKVLINNSSAIRYNETLGYKTEASNEKYITMSLTRDSFEKAKIPLKKILRF